MAHGETRESEIGRGLRRGTPRGRAKMMDGDNGCDVFVFSIIIYLFRLIDGSFLVGFGVLSSRDAKALQEKAAKKAGGGEAAASGNAGGNKGTNKK
ncbi:hypothetical protein EJ110_NYTH17049 [Nymphaea thermarum]|nr:hypothetical protein EJ110_NYTH17049 [Nymphaea thermarum]